jgi:transposase
MSRVNTPFLDPSSRSLLEKGYREGKKHAFRKRCQVILLKAEGRDSKSVGSIVNMCAMSVNTWVKRYKAEGLSGLETKAGRGRKAVLNKEQDQAAILAAVKANRQRVDIAKAEWEAQNTDKVVSRDTFRRFLKALAANTNA